MATKKAVATKKTVAKKPVAKKSKTTSAAKARRVKTPVAKSFKLSRSDAPFFTFAITRQTVYWLIIVLTVLAMGLWIINLQNKINEIYDAIEMNQSSYNQPIILKHTK